MKNNKNISVAMLKLEFLQKFCVYLQDFKNIC